MEISRKIFCFIACLTLFEFNELTKEPEAEHLSWELGIPDNTVFPEIIVDPYLPQEIDQWKESRDYQY